MLIFERRRRVAVNVVVEGGFSKWNPCCLCESVLCVKAVAAFHLVSAFSLCSSPRCLFNSFSHSPQAFTQTHPTLPILLPYYFIFPSDLTTGLTYCHVYWFLAYNFSHFSISEIDVFNNQWHLRFCKINMYNLFSLLSFSHL